MMTGVPLMTKPRPDTANPWHALPAQQVAQELDSPQVGISSGEAERRLATHGPNALASARARHPVLRFLHRFHHLLLYLMTGAGIITARPGQSVHAGVA